MREISAPFSAPKMDDATLQEMAQAGDGIYFPAGTRDLDFDELYERIHSRVESCEFETARKELYRALFQWFAGAALLLLLLVRMIPLRLL